jgi:uncharacterized membrane protein
MKGGNSAAGKKLHFLKKDAIYFGFESAKKNIRYFVSVFVLVLVIYLLLEWYERTVLSQHVPLLYFIIVILIWIFDIIISMGIIKITLAVFDNKKPHISDVFYTKPIINYIIVSIIRSLIVLVGFMLLIVPGIIFAIKLQFAEYLVVDKNSGIMDSLKTSWEMTRGVKWNLFVLGILFGLINLVGLLCLLVGLFFTVPLSLMAQAYVYRKLYSQVK